MLRLTSPLDELRFDAVALLELGNRGIRELDLHGDALWGIAGRPVDSRDGFGLWRLPLQAFEPGRRIRIDSFPQSLPAGAEGLVFSGDRGIVLLDVERPVQGGACQSLQYSVGTDAIGAGPAVGSDPSDDPN
jgi:hypothetical protein